MPLLSDTEMNVILSLSRPIAEERRSAFVEAVVSELENAAGIGEGAVHRVARQLQRQFWEPPELPNITGAARHNRVRAVA